jgi:hypothetical protein
MKLIIRIHAMMNRAVVILVGDDRCVEHKKQKNKECVGRHTLRAP